MPPGVLWVSSRTLSASLPASKLCTWYESTHIPEVLALPGIPRAARYEAHPKPPGPSTYSSEAPWLTVYEMPDVEYRETSEFKSLDGQSEPRKELLEGVFRKARFDTRFYEGVQEFGADAVTGPANLLISAALQPAAGQDADFDAWYRQEHLHLLSKCPGYRRSRRFKVVNATVLDKFERREPEVPQYLALHEFDGEDFPMEALGGTAGTEWAKKVMGNLNREEVGWYRLKREYREKDGAKV
ncbi:hypothetical protein K505DRAFT_422566 [Melanomma pulvis-pyrius CBS 109.77]|uniref:EthD domain-containing protein n=1 Tax=Melanomma pulvis-pyrius CBS 109.77 TaxID=1314802 RepID=A0A6A6WQM1_9PLEO|nr:hypothetical protein K505DRAFT_422566 [Melanomma pulvis-pyrius CBS 109.77]